MYTKVQSWEGATLQSTWLIAWYALAHALVRGSYPSLDLAFWNAMHSKYITDRNQPSIDIDDQLLRNHQYISEWATLQSPRLIKRYVHPSTKLRGSHPSKGMADEMLCTLKYKAEKGATLQSTWLFQWYVFAIKWWEGTTLQLTQLMRCYELASKS